MKTLIKKIGLVLVVVLMSIVTKAQYYVHEADSILFSNQTNYEYYITCNPDSLVSIKGVDGDDLVLKTIKISFWLAQDSRFEKDHILLELQTLNSYKSNKNKWVKEKILMEDIDKDDEHEFGEGTIVVIG